MARARIHPDGLVTALLGDRSLPDAHLRTVLRRLRRHLFTAVICDNDGYAIIHRLQTGQGAPGFNNLFDDCAGPGDLRVGFSAHARALGCDDLDGGASTDTLRGAYAAARDARTTVAPP